MKTKEEILERFDKDYQDERTYSRDSILQAMQEYAELYAQTRWIPCSERLPENADGGNEMIWCITSRPIYGSHESYFNPVVKRFLTMGFTVIEDVTHWMPLPDSPNL